MVMTAPIASGSALSSGLAGGDQSREIKIRRELILPLLAKYLWTDDQALSSARPRAASSLINEARADRFAETDVVGE